jgi:hypothetical protein
LFQSLKDQKIRIPITKIVLKVMAELEHIQLFVENSMKRRKMKKNLIAITDLD